MIRNAIVVLLISCSIFITLSSLCCADESNEQQYTVGLGDVIDINVLGHDELKTKAPVTSDGLISFPYIGSINVKGLSLSDIEKEISKRLSGSYIKYPVVSVTLTRYEAVIFFVYGEVKNPGKYILESNMTVLKAISTAGGITADGLYGKVKLRRKQKGGKEYKEITIDLKNTTESTMNCDMPIEDEDIVVVERSKDFFVYGEVMRPGKYTLVDNMTVLRAISVAGGFAKFGSPDRVKILRTVPGKVGYENIKVDIKGAVKGEVGKDIGLQSEDIVIVMEGIL